MVGMVVMCGVLYIERWRERLGDSGRERKMGDSGPGKRKESAREIEIEKEGETRERKNKVYYIFNM